MKWNVYYYNSNRERMETYNIFNHYGFVKYVIEHLKKIKNKDDFALKLKSELMYYFWSKAEWEIIISSWPNRDNDELKIDVFDQVMLNWEAFVDYCWSNKKKILKLEL